MTTLEKEKASVISNLRACLISANDGIRISQLNSDYRQLVGETIPFQRLGYRSVDEFLKCVPNISVKVRGGEAYVEAKASESSAHISSLVKEQKRSKRKPALSRKVVHIQGRQHPRYRTRAAPRTIAPPQRPPVKRYTPHANISNGQNKPVSNHIKFENNNEEQVNRNSIKRTDSSTSTKNQAQTHYRYSESPSNNRSSSDFNTSSSSSNSTPSPIHRNSNPSNRVESIPDTPSSKLSARNSMPSNRVEFSHDTPTSKLSARLQKSQTAVPSYHSQPEHPLESRLSSRLKQVKHSVPLTVDTSFNLPTSFDITPNNSPGSSKSPGTPTSGRKGAPPKVPKLSVQSRLEKARLSLPDQKLRVVVDHQQGEKGSFFQNELSLYVKKQNWSQEPSYVVYNQKSGRHQVCFASTVRIVIPRMSKQLPEEILECSTFPNDFLDPTEAKENAAKLALDKLQEREQFVNAPVLRNTESLISYVQKSVGEKENGIWAHKFEDEFKLIHKKLLPEHWLDIVKKSATFEVEELGPSCIIRKKDEATSRYSPAKLKMPSLTFPAGNTWDVYITGGKSVNDVRLRFIGDEFSARFDKFSTEMEKWYEKKENLVQPLLVIGEYYAAYFDNAWWRVMVTKIDRDKIRVKCIDHGDEEEISRSQLYKLEPQFFKVPPQAISVALKDLEEFIERKDAEDLFIKTIVGRSLVAVAESIYSVVLYDTANEEAVNLNEELRRLFEVDYQRPIILEVGSVYEMFFCSVDMDGTVYVQVVTDAYVLLQDLLELVEENNYESLKDPNELDVDKIYFVYKENNYVRAKPRTSYFIDGKVEVTFIDYGCSDHVFLEDITNLEDISYLLGHIPGQAIPIHLHDISPSSITPALRGRLVQLACSDDPPPVIVGRVRDMNGNIPVVELFMRMTPDNLLVSINQTLVLESGLNLTNLNHKLEDLSLKKASSIKQQSSDRLSTMSCNFPLNSIERIINDNRPPLPLPNEEFQIYVHDTASPSHFLINPQDYMSSLNKMMDEMNAFYNQNNLRGKITEGAFCAAKDNGFWYRVCIDRLIDNENVSAKILDYGCVKIIATSNIKPLLDIYKKHPYIGFCAKIHGISPIHGDWSVEDCILMKKMINKKTLNARLKDIVLNKSSLGGVLLSLQLIATDPHTFSEFDVADRLVQQKHAIYLKK